MDKSPRSGNGKKVGKTLKEKRADKKVKTTERGAAGRVADKVADAVMPGRRSR